MHLNPKFSLLGYRLVMSRGLRQRGCYPLFVTSDSSPVRGRASRENMSLGLRLLGRDTSSRTGSNSQNTYRVRRVGPNTKFPSETLCSQRLLSDQALSYQKANGAGSVTPKRSRLVDAHTGTVTTSGLGEVCLG